MVPGTFGSAVGVLLFLVLSAAGLSPGPYALVVVAVAGVGIWAAGHCETIFAAKDDRRIVIDEVAGQLVTLAPIPLLGLQGWLPVVTGFVVFRVLDIWKPGPVRWTERRLEGGLGVVADDLVAGLLGGLLLGVGALAAAGLGWSQP